MSASPQAQPFDGFDIDHRARQALSNNLGDGAFMVEPKVDRLRRDLDREGYGPFNDFLVEGSNAVTRQAIDLSRGVLEQIHAYPMISLLIGVQLGYVLGRLAGRSRRASH